MFANAFLFLALAYLIKGLFPGVSDTQKWRWWHTIAFSFFCIGCAFLITGIYMTLLRYLI